MLLEGYAITGNVVGEAGTTDTLILGGNAKATFDVSQIGEVDPRSRTVG